MKVIQPYSKLASIYDRLMDHVDYLQWSDYILSLLHHSSKKITSLIDLSCGTGSLLFHLNRKIKTVYGCDSSRDMIREAQKKKIINPGNLFINDIRRMAITTGYFDCALVLYDSLNYLVDEKSLKSSLSEINRILKKDGVFIFDIVSEEHCIEHYGDFHESEYWKDSGYSRHSFYDSKSGYQYNEFRIVLKGQTYIEKHQQKIYGLEYLNHVLKQKAFEILGTFKDFSNEDADNDQGRVHFLCMKL